MTDTDPTLDYFTPAPGVNPRWGRRIAAGFAGSLLILPSLLLLMCAMSAMIIAIVELAAPHGTVFQSGWAALMFILFGGSGLLVGWIATRLLDFAQRNTLKRGR